MVFRQNAFPKNFLEQGPDFRPEYFPSWGRFFAAPIRTLTLFQKFSPHPAQIHPRFARNGGFSGQNRQNIPKVGRGWNSKDPPPPLEELSGPPPWVHIVPGCYMSTIQFTQNVCPKNIHLAIFSKPTVLQKLWVLNL